MSYNTVGDWMTERDFKRFRRFGLDRNEEIAEMPNGEFVLDEDYLEACDEIDRLNALLIEEHELNGQLMIMKLSTWIDKKENDHLKKENEELKAKISDLQGDLDVARTCCEVGNMALDEYEKREKEYEFKLMEKDKEITHLKSQVDKAPCETEIPTMTEDFRARWTGQFKAGRGGQEFYDWMERLLSALEAEHDRARFQRSEQNDYGRTNDG